MVRIRHILCPVDLSECSRHAFNRAVAVARTYGADITVLHVLPMPSAVPALPYGPEGPGPFGFEAIDRERALTEITHFLGADRPIGVPLHFHVAEAPAVHREVLQQTSLLSADLVVLGTHGRTGFDRLFLGSVAEKTLRLSRVPVLIVPPHAPDAVPPGADPFRRIVCAVDFSQDSARALGYAMSLARYGAGRLTVVHSVESVPIGYDPMAGATFDVIGYQDALEKSARAELQRFFPDSVALGCETDSVVTRGTPYREILDIAAEREADLIALGVHGRNALDRLVFGSTTQQVVRRATCPVLVVPTADAG